MVPEAVAVALLAATNPKPGGRDCEITTPVACCGPALETINE